MGCGSCGAGHDPYAAHRSKGKRTSRGTSVGVLKSEKRKLRETSRTSTAKKESKILKTARVLSELPLDIPASGIIKSSRFQK